MAAESIALFADPSLKSDAIGRILSQVAISAIVIEERAWH
jgi:hypothetical protein